MKEERRDNESNKRANYRGYIRRLLEKYGLHSNAVKAERGSRASWAGSNNEGNLARIHFHSVRVPAASREESWNGESGKGAP